MSDTAKPVTPASLHQFFATSAGVAGALIGLLFVALSVAHGRRGSDMGGQTHRVRASAALTSFTNALTVSLFALVPGIGIRWPSFVVGALGLLFVAGSLLSLRRLRHTHPVAPRDTLFLAGLLATFGLQLYFSLRLISNGSDGGAARGIAVIVIVCFLIGIARSWELVGGPTIGFTSELAALFLGRNERQGPSAEADRHSEKQLDEP